MTKRRLTADEVARLLEMYRDGVKRGLIAETFGVRVLTVDYHAKKAGLSRKTETDPDLVDRILELRESGWTYREIAGHLGITANQAQHHCLWNSVVPPGDKLKHLAGGFTAAEDAEIQRLRLQGTSTGKIAEIVGRHVNSVVYRLRLLAAYEGMEEAA